MKIDSGKLLTRISESPYGTGTLSDVTRIDNLTMERIIASGAATDEQVAAIEGYIGKGWVIRDNRDASLDLSLKADLEANSVANIKALVMQGSYDAAEVLELEKLADDPRVTLTRWLEDYLD